MSPSSRSRLRKTLRARISAELARDANIPGAVVAYARRDGRIRILAIGQTGDLTRPLQPADLFPVASVSKLATALLVLRLTNASGIRLSDPIGRYVQSVAHWPIEVSVGRLLCHCGGLPDQPAGLANLPDWRVRVSQSAAVIPANVGNFSYSSFGYDVLGALCDTIEGDFHRAVRNLVLKPLKILGSWGEVPMRAPVAIGGGPSAANFNGPDIRRFGSPHGGLFTDAEGALKLVRAFSADSHFMKPRMRAMATRLLPQVAANPNPPLVDPTPPWGLGPELRGGKIAAHYAPKAASQESYGHFGASGSLAWWDPRTRSGWAILASAMPTVHWHFNGRRRISALLQSATLRGLLPLNLDTV